MLFRSGLLDDPQRGAFDIVDYFCRAEPEPAPSNGSAFSRNAVHGVFGIYSPWRLVRNKQATGLDRSAMRRRSMLNTRDAACLETSSHAWRKTSPHPSQAPLPSRLLRLRAAGLFSGSLRLLLLPRAAESAENFA